MELTTQSLQNKNTFNNLFKEELSKIAKLEKKPTLLLHACCGPCLTYPLSILIDKFDVTVLYVNPNIYPVSEYEKRFDTLKKFVESYQKDRGIRANLVKLNEDFEKYQSLFKEREHDYEGGSMCLKCHEYRMNLAYKYASEFNFDYFTTVMTVSCKKPSYELNLIGDKLSKIYSNTKYLFSDFKKENGQLIGIQICKKYNLYRQDYCGCNFSLNEKNRRKKEAKFIG